MSLQESGEMYLETLLILSQKGAAVRAVDIGSYMSFSKPSVSRAVSLLKQGGYIRADESGHLILTEEGRRVAEKTYERHRLLRDFFIRLGVDRALADDDACRIEHHISDETFEALRRHLRTLPDKK